MIGTLGKMKWGERDISDHTEGYVQILAEGSQGQGNVTQIGKETKNTNGDPRQWGKSTSEDAVRHHWESTVEKGITLPITKQ